MWSHLWLSKWRLATPQRHQSLVLIKHYLTYPFFLSTEFLRKSFKIIVLLHTYIPTQRSSSSPKFSSQKNLIWWWSQKHFTGCSCCSAGALLPSSPMHRWTFPASEPLSSRLLLLPGSPLPGWLTSYRCCSPAVSRLALIDDRCACSNLACFLAPWLTEGSQLCLEPPFLIFSLCRIHMTTAVANYQVAT